MLKLHARRESAEEGLPSRLSLQREKKRARKEETANKAKNEISQEVGKVEEVPEEKPSKKQKMLKPPKKQKRDKDGLDDLINEYKSSFTKVMTNTAVGDEQTNSATANDRSSVAKKRWFEYNIMKE